MSIDLEKIDINEGERVIVAMSGGVDSSLSALIAKEKGAKVIGVTLKMFENSLTPLEDAEKVANSIGVEWHSADYSKEFEQSVITYFIREYKNGRTPNPCVLCNRVAKTKFLFDMMQKFDATKIVTGHYARTKLVDGQKYIRKAVSLNKDQSYYLSMIEPFHVNLLAFPLGEIDKEETRALAKKFNIPVADKKDSQEACFIEGTDYRDFLAAKNLKSKKGKFVLKGKEIADNLGIHNYTIGQRRGLDISYSEPLYVKDIDEKSGNVILDTKSNTFVKGVALRDCSFFPRAKMVDRVRAKIRYRMEETECKMERSIDGKCFLLFDKAMFAPAKGQTAVIYEDDLVIGAGVIDHVF